MIKRYKGRLTHWSRASSRSMWIKGWWRCNSCRRPLHWRTRRSSFRALKTPLWRAGWSRRSRRGRNSATWSRNFRTWPFATHTVLRITTNSYSRRTLIMMGLSTLCSWRNGQATGSISTRARLNTAYPKTNDCSRRSSGNTWRPLLWRYSRSKKVQPSGSRALKIGSRILSCCFKRRKARAFRW